MATINFKDGVDASTFSDHSREVLTYLLDASGNASCLITCLGRTPRQQAQAMHDNCVLHGTELQYATYRGPGQQVINVFVKDTHKSAADTIADMEAEIVTLGPETVSKHCADQSLMNVADISERPETGMVNPAAFRKVALAHVGADVTQCLEENSVIHVVFPQPKVNP